MSTSRHFRTGGTARLHPGGVMGEWRREPPREDLVRQLDQFRKSLSGKLDPLRQEVRAVADAFMESVNTLMEVMNTFGNELDETLNKLNTRVIGLETLSLMARPPVCSEVGIIDAKCMIAGLDDGLVVVHERGDIEKLTLRGEQTVRLTPQGREGASGRGAPTCVAAHNGRVFVGLAQGSMLILDARLQQVATVHLDECPIRKILPTPAQVFVASGYHVSVVDQSWQKQQSITVGESQLMDAADETLLLGVEHGSIGVRQISTPRQTDRVCEFAPHAALLGDGVLVAGPKVPGVATWVRGAGQFVARFDLQEGAVFAQRARFLLAVAWPGQLRLVPLHPGGELIALPLPGRPVSVAWVGASLIVLVEDGKMIRVSNKFAAAR